MARISLRSLKAWLPLNLIFPTLTLGPSSILKTRMTALLEAMRSYCGVTLANCRPCSASNSFSTTSAFLIFDLGAFLDFENENDGVAGSDALVLRSDFSELPAMLGQQLLQHDFRFLDLGGIKLAFNTETDFAFLEAIENVGFGNGVVAVVTDASDLRAFFDLEDDNFAVRAIGRVFHTKLYVLKELRVPKGLKIAAQRLFIVDIAGPAEDSRRQGVAAHAAVANEIDTLDHKLLLRGGLRVPRRMIFDNVFAVCVVKGSREKIGMRRCGGMRAGIF